MVVVSNEYTYSLPKNHSSAQRSVGYYDGGDSYSATRYYERQLQNCDDGGKLNLEVGNQLLDQNTYHVFYRSQMANHPTKARLQELLSQSRTYNAQHNITGLLLYSDDQFAQVIEGTKKEVLVLYNRIQQDPRHQQVITIRKGGSSQRWFADWHMAFGHLESVVLTDLLRVVEQGRQPLLPLDDPHAQTLVEAFRPAKLVNA